jgi:hypothetical protein
MLVYKAFNIKEDIHYEQFPTKYRSKRNNCTKWSIPDHRCKELIKVYTLFLGEASSSESSCVLLNTFVSCKLLRPFCFLHYFSTSDWFLLKETNGILGFYYAADKD